MKMSKPRSSRRTFPFKLWSLINSDKETGLEWTPDGNMIVIDKKVFVQKCLGNDGGTFKTCKFLSITKQLNVYGFVQHFSERKSNLNPMFVSPYFKRDFPSLLSHFSRKHASFNKCSPVKQNSIAAPKKTASRPVLASIGNLQEKSRTQPMRKARLTVKKCNSPVCSSNSSASAPPKISTTTSAKSSPTVVSYEVVKSPYILRKSKSYDPVAAARLRFHEILQNNVREVLALPTGLTSSNKSSPLFTDVSNKPVKFPPPPKTKPDRVMLSGHCPLTPPLGLAYSVNPNAFITSPWREYYNMSIADGEIYIVEITD